MRARTHTHVNAVWDQDEYHEDKVKSPVEDGAVPLEDDEDAMMPLDAQHPEAKKFLLPSDAVRTCMRAH